VYECLSVCLSVCDTLPMRVCHRQALVISFSPQRWRRTSYAVHSPPPVTTQSQLQKSQFFFSFLSFYLIMYVFIYYLSNLDDWWIKMHIYIYIYYNTCNSSFFTVTVNDLTIQQTRSSRMLKAKYCPRVAPVASTNIVPKWHHLAKVQRFIISYRVHRAKKN